MTPTRVSAFRRWLTESSAPLRFAVVVAVAASAAYLIGSLIPVVAAIPAAITAVVSARPTFHEGVKEGLVQVGGTLLGGFAAAGLVVVFGPTAWLIGVSVAVVLIAGVLLRQKPETMLAVGVPIILIIGTHATTDLVWARLWGVGVGALIAMLASLYASPGTPTQRVARAATPLGVALADHVETMGARLHYQAAGQPLDVATLRDWLITVEDLQRDLYEVRRDAEQALNSSTWLPITDTHEARRVLHHVLAIDIATSTAANMGRDLLLAQQEGGIPDTLLPPLGDIMITSARLIRQHADPAAAEPEDLIAQLTDAQNRALGQVRDLDATGPLALGAAMWQDATKMRMLFDPDRTNG